MELKAIYLPFLLAVSMLLFVACKEESQTSDLLTAVDKGQSDVVQKLLNSGINPNKDAGPDGERVRG